ncbi:hypothetical protein CDD82_3772 [Ophiocordyceps australis]|uniref:Uncharacterized protein n=1 Tax=Ophiocordyceps australis TaxID=1399860 RepID=A0A2C5ZBT9_9HYPO|nr:hypothetical protein CDD82_3772 [Ophiocordyceps australis]
MVLAIQHRGNIFTVDDVLTHTCHHIQEALTGFQFLQDAFKAVNDRHTTPFGVGWAAVVAFLHALFIPVTVTTTTGPRRQKRHKIISYNALTFGLGWAAVQIVLYTLFLPPTIWCRLGRCGGMSTRPFYPPLGLI